MGVLGCGWLGLPLANELVASGYPVKGTTTSVEKLEVLVKNGIDPYKVALTENHIDGNIGDFLKDIETLIINVPPKLRQNKGSNYVKKMEHLAHAISKSKLENILFVSSTSVYGIQEGEITEETPPNPKTESAKQLHSAENLFTQMNPKTTLVRFGGLIGPDRHPVYQVSKRQGLTNGDELINLIHLNDCILMIKTIIKNNYWNEIFNGVYPKHPRKRDYYSMEAGARNLPTPDYAPSSVNAVLKSVKSENYLAKGHTFYTSLSS
ncbi:MAG: SDR family NAD(P)-dependent oxidoreductase [Allomuricauda sp.]|nr:MAG: SDR family NAD(P)-dependent oxidoreductase [Allomuricauda sp.]